MSVNGAAREYSQTMSFDENGDRTYTVVYHVETTSRTDGSLTALTASGLPNVGDIYQFHNETDYNAYCQGPVGEIAYVDLDNSAKLWAIPFQWSTKGQANNKNSGSDKGPGADEHISPDGQWRISGDTNMLLWAMDADANGTPIRTSAGSRFSPAMEAEIPSPVLVLERRTSYLPLLTWAQVTGTINSSAYLGLPAYSWRCKWSWSLGWRGNGSAYVENRVELACKWDLWTSSPLDQDFYYIDPMKPTKDDGTPNPRPIVVNGELVAEPRMLDGNGGLLADGATPVLLDGTHGSRDLGPFFRHRQTDFNLYFPAVLPGPFT